MRRPCRPSISCMPGCGRRRPRTRWCWSAATRPRRWLPGGEVVSMTCEGPYQAHAPFAPNCALADVRPDSALVICSSQDIYACRKALAPILELPETAIRVRFAPGRTGTYGHSLYDDVAQAAAILSKLAGRPVRVQLMRHDEHGWDTYGPAHARQGHRLGRPRRQTRRLSLRGLAAQLEPWSRPRSSWPLGTAATEWGVFLDQVALKTCGGQYAIPHLRLINHHVPGQGYLRAAWLRSPLDLSCAFVFEQAIDALAHRLGHDHTSSASSTSATTAGSACSTPWPRRPDWPRRAVASARIDGPSGQGHGVEPAPTCSPGARRSPSWRSSGRQAWCASSGSMAPSTAAWRSTPAIWKPRSSASWSSCRAGCCRRR